MNKIIHPVEPEELMAHLDGELSGEKASNVAAHLSGCAECREVVAELRGVSKALATLAVDPADATVSPALSAALEENTEKTRRISVARPAWRTILRRRWQSAAWIGAFAALVVVAYMGTVQRRAEYDIAPSPVAESQPTTRPTDSVSPKVYGYIDTKSAHAPGLAANARSQEAYSLSADIAAPSAPPPLPSGKTNVPTVSGPMIIRTADLALITKDFDNARSAVETILKRHRGYVGELKVGGSAGSGRTLTATLRVPADQLDASMADLKTLGRVELESQSGQDVTSQYVDLQARLANSRNTEWRLTDLLSQRTGKLADVLEVEQEVDRVRGEIEQMEAERKNMSNQVSYAVLNATITEDYKAQLQVVPPSTSTRLSNAAVDGYKSMVDGVVGLALFLLENVPTLFLWLAILFLPARLVWKKVRRSFAQ